MSPIRTSPPISDGAPGHVAMPLSGREWNRIWDFGLPNITASGGEAERQDGLGALPVISVSFLDTLDQPPQTDFKYWFWLTSDDVKTLHCRMC